MKTRSDFTVARNLFYRRVAWRLGALLFFAIWIATLGWLPKKMFAWMPPVVAISFLWFVPVIVIHLVIRGMKHSAKECGLVCPSCGKEVVSKEAKLDVVLASNKCPSCGGALYIP
jgi:predicted RNA-binding Zn-ribbon protein involved in translation (DUF1610 family)